MIIRQMDRGLLLQLALLNASSSSLSSGTHVVFLHHPDRHKSQTHFDEQKKAEAAASRLRVALK